ncbi:MAG: prolyl-tRNA synthetase associated domain-containing protein [Desulfomonilia bacterium]|nr:prolyl-tRNA synthetase associated domain-containing protein [Desulfomonilia bacterium]
MDIYEFFAQHAIGYQRYDHEPVFTCEQADRLDLPGGSAKTKNLFLRDRKGRRHFLISVMADKTVNVKALEEVLEVKGLSFASPERLMKHLGLTPGAVTILGVLNDRDSRVEVIVDEDLWKCSSLQCHPQVNTSTLIISLDDVRRFLKLTDNPVRVLRIPCRNGES